MRMCLHQFARPRFATRNDGCGDCTVCEPNADNVNCRKYCPIEATIVFVKDSEKDLNYPSSIFKEDETGGGAGW